MNLWDSRGARRWRRNQYGGAIIRKLLITFRDERQNSFANRSGILWIFPLWDQCGITIKITIKVTIEIKNVRGTPTFGGLGLPPRTTPQNIGVFWGPPPLH